MKRNELVALAKENGIAKAHQTKSVDLEAALAKLGVSTTEKSETRGRKVDPNSARQKRLAEMAAKAEANGGVLKRGREVDPNSARQMKLAAIQAKIDAGIEIKRGRPAGSKNKEV